MPAACVSKYVDQGAAIALRRHLPFAALWITRSTARGGAVSPCTSFSEEQRQNVHERTIWTTGAVSPVHPVNPSSSRKEISAHHSQILFRMIERILKAGNQAWYFNNIKLFDLSEGIAARYPEIVTSPALKCEV